jgi:dihydrofolate reductase
MLSSRPHPIYLIVATSVCPPLGIGLRGQLPWPPLKADMSFFKRVTTRPPVPAETKPHAEVKNAVIMGRKTWDSVPAKFRPLRDRINVVISRSKTAQDLAGPAGSEDLLVTPNLPDALSALEKLQSSKGIELGKTFIIGGSEVYRAAYEDLLISNGVTLRVVQTQVRRRDGAAIECDTFFPPTLEQMQPNGSGTEARRATAEEVEEWVGERLPQRGKGHIVKSDDRVEGVGDWLEDGEMQIRVVGEEFNRK